MKILFNRHSKKYLPILIDDTSDMDKVINLFEEWIKNFDNEMLLDFDIPLTEGQYSVSEEFEGMISIVIYREDEYTRYVSLYDFELKDLSIITQSEEETQCRTLIFNGNDIRMLLSDKNVQSISLIDDIEAFDLMEKDADYDKLDNVTCSSSELLYFGLDHIGTTDFGLYSGTMDYDKVTAVKVCYYDDTEIFINKNFQKEIIEII